ncbi:MAG: hypothetical protein LUD17_05280 [Bacteroidales bacterium]|nr:hypothetical protein [Bacteroidales bacterium]
MSTRETLNKILFKVNRIERKCDALQAEVARLWQSLKPRPNGVDAVIDRLRSAAKSLKAQAEREKRQSRKWKR